MKTVYQDENNVVLDENNVECKLFINIESKSLELKIQLYSCHGINMKFLVVVTPPSIYQIQYPLKISIRFLLKYSARFVTGFSVVNSQIPLNPRNSPKSRLWASILLLVSTVMTLLIKVLVRKRENAVSKFKTLIHSLLVPSSLAASNQQPYALLWSKPLDFHPSLYTGWSVSPVGLGLLQAPGSLS